MSDVLKALVLLFPEGIPLVAYGPIIDIIQTAAARPFAVTMRYVVDGLPSGLPKEPAPEAPHPVLTLTSKEAAEYLGMTYIAFRGRVKRGQIQPSDIDGRTHLFTHDELNRFKDSQVAQK